MRQRRGDRHIDEIAHQTRVTRKVYDTIVVGPAGKLVGILLRRAFDQNALNAADHAGADLSRVLLDALLQARKAGEFDVGRAVLFMGIRSVALSRVALDIFRNQ